MRMNRIVAVPAIASLCLVGACGNSNDSASNAASSAATAAGSSASSATSAATSATSSASGTTSPSSSGTSSATASEPTEPSDCPTENTRAFAKTRFVADLGVAAGTFHRYIYQPYQQGKFAKGADGRVTAIAKAGATAALDIHLLKNAQKNVKASPALCKALAKPMSEAISKLDSIKGDITSGNFSSVLAAQSLMSTITTKSGQNGAPITPSTDTSKVMGDAQG